MNHTLITNDVIKENIPSGQSRYDSWLHKRKWVKMNGRAGSLRNKGRSCAIVNTISYAF